MDSRDITEPVPNWAEKGLEKIFSLQQELIDLYKGIEKFPDFPLNLNIRENQYWVKDFSARVVEELGEAYQSYELLVNGFNENLKKEGEKKSFEDLLPHLQNFNEELSDALHFLLELFLACGIDVEALRIYYEKLLKEKNLYDGIFFRDNLFKTVMAYAQFCNSETEILRTAKVYPAFNLLKETGVTDDFMQGGRKISNELQIGIQISFWDVTYYLQIARNCLKNKPWKAYEMLTDSNSFHGLLMEAWLHLMRAFNFVDLDENAIMTIYFKKNRINHFRVKSKY